MSPELLSPELLSPELLSPELTGARAVPGTFPPHDAWMLSKGDTVLRFTNAEVLANVEGVVLAIRDEIERLRAL